jgi:alkylhydroperoxidase/carboxymuconolactone decarboxylase family protein YurZ
MTTPEQLRSEALALIRDVPEREGLTAMEAALIDMAVHGSPSTLDFDRADKAARAAILAGATPAQLHEILVLVSALGVHTLMSGCTRIGRIAGEFGDPSMQGPLDEARKALWDEHIGEHGYWKEFETVVPGFLEALLRQSPAAFKAFFVYCGLPWESAAVPPRLKELISLAVDISPTHRYGPGFRLHLRNALKLGAS